MTTRGAGNTAGAKGQEGERSGASEGPAAVKLPVSAQDADRVAERFRASWESPEPSAEPVARSVQPAEETFADELPAERTKRSRVAKEEKEGAAVPESIGVVESSRTPLLLLGLGVLIVGGIAGVWVWDLGRGTSQFPDETASTPPVEQAAVAPPSAAAAVETPPAEPVIATVAEPAPITAEALPTPAPEPAPAPVAVAPPPPPPPVIPPPPPAPVLVSVRIRAEPAAAALTLDGRAVSNPFEQRIEQGEEPHRFEARLEGYRPAQESVTFERDRAITLRLDRIPEARPAAPPRETARAAERPAPRRPQERTERRPPRSSGGFVSDNPFD